MVRDLLNKILESELAATLVGWLMILTFLFLLTGATIWSFKWVLYLLFGI